MIAIITDIPSTKIYNELYVIAYYKHQDLSLTPQVLVESM